MKFIRPLTFALLILGSLGQIGCATVTSSTPAQTTQPSSAIHATSLSPNAVTAGQTGFVLTVKGANFERSSVVLWNGSPRATSFVSADELTAQIVAADVASASTASVAVMNSTTQVQSNALQLTVNGQVQITSSQLPGGVVGASYDAPIAASGGASPLHWSVADGSLPPGITMDSSTGTLTGSAAATGNFTFTAWVTDALNSSSKASLTVAITATAGSAGSAGSESYMPPGYYGPGLGADGLANTTLGPNGNAVSYRIRARHSGVLENVHVYLISDRKGYAAGNGGTIQVTLHADDGTAAHNPSLKVLATYVMSNVPSLPSPARYFYVFKFPLAPTLTAGDLYHFVFKNIGPSPTVNYLSVDDLYQAVPTTPEQPTMNDMDCAVLLSEAGSAWTLRRGYTPIYELDFSNGVTEGIGYIEGWIGSPEYISGTKAVRETFTISGSSVTVASVAVRVARVSGSSPLTVRLEHANGALIEEISIPATQIAESNATAPHYAWMKAAFSSAQTLVAGQTYHLDLEASAPTEYMAFPIRKGLSYGFHSTTYFPDGRAEFTQNGSWVGWTQWGATNRTDGDLQFYFVP
jgi:Putative Ig domain